MHKVLLDRSLQERLPELSDQVELCDEAGRTLGYFIPADLHHELMYAWAKSQFADEAELEAARRELESSGGLTTTELLDRLASLPSAGS